MALTPEERAYYENRVQQELELIDEDRESIRRRTAESFRVFLEQLAQKIGTAVEELLEFFGPLFAD